MSPEPTAQNNKPDTLSKLACPEATQDPLLAVSTGQHGEYSSWLSLGALTTPPRKPTYRLDFNQIIPADD